jgi:carboxyl-terminal processing protease
VLDTSSPLAAFEQLWQLTREQIYPLQRAETHFDAATYETLRAKAKGLNSVAELPGVFNPFLNSLEVSHTQLYGQHDLEHAFFRSLFSTRDLNTPPFSHSGLQFVQQSGRWWVREVWDGLPADRAGLRRGDNLLTIDGSTFTPQKLCDGGSRRSTEPQLIELRRGTALLSVSLPCVWGNPHASLHDALLNSEQKLPVGDHEVGYLHLWTGTGSVADRRELFRAAVANLADTDALILDLRGGFGGAWYEHLDPFFANRDEFYAFTVIDREGSTVYQPEAHETSAPYTRPMAVLINEGTRSGKEAVAFQFKKSGRAVLIGTTTKGAFTAGKGLFVNDNSPLVFYLSVAEYRLDGQRIEGVGIAPDIEVPYPAVRPFAALTSKAIDDSGGDPQLAAAIAYLSGVLRDEAAQTAATEAP